MCLIALVFPWNRTVGVLKTIHVSRVVLMSLEW